MENYLLYFLKLNLYLILLIISYKIGFRKNANFKFSRPYLLFGVFVAILLSAVNFSTLNQYGEQIAMNDFLQEIVVNGNTISSSMGFNWSMLLFCLYCIGSAFFFIRFILQIKHLIVLKSQAVQADDYFIIPNSTAAFSFMNWIFIGDGLTEKDQQMVVLHEKVHVAKNHSIDLILCHLLEIFLWVNPMVFQFKHLFDEVHEYEADELSCHQEEDYLYLLLKQNLNHFSSLPIHQFNSTHLKKRIMRIKTKSSKRINPKSVALTIGAFGLLFFINQNLSSNETKLNPTQLSFPYSSLHGKVDKKAQFPGGSEALSDYIIKNTKFPKRLIDSNIEEKVFVEFTVGADGAISEVNLKNKVDAELGKMALEAIRKMPNWEPAVKDGKKVASKLTLPISFLPPPPPSAPQSPPAPPKPIKVP